MKFVNPYTFISLGNGKSKFLDNDPQKLSGKIHCRLITKTQLCIPDVVSGTDGYGMDIAPFFRIDGKAVIPGSGIRGCIRNVYEALTNSCIHINDKESDYFTSRYNKDTPGLIKKENGKYYLYEAERFRIMKNVDADTSDAVSFELYVRDDNDRSEYDIANNVKKTNETPLLEYNFDLEDGQIYTGIFHRVNTFVAKGRNHPSVFVSTGNAPVIINSAYIIRLKENIERYDNKAEYDAKGNYKKAIDKMEKENGFLPVWYSQENGHYYFAPSKNSRAVYYNKPRDIIRKMNYQSCSNTSNLCEACALFGFVDTKGTSNSIGSKVRFGDAVCNDTDCFEGRCILPILSNPRLSSFEFYLNGITPDDDNARISGRKFYWHHKNKHFDVSDPDCEKPVGDKKAIEIAQKSGKDNFASKGSDHELVKTGTVFEFDVYFDRITLNQLEKLVFSLNLGENDAENGKLCHKLGHGKPVGLGSVKIVIDSIITRDNDSERKVYSIKKDGYNIKSLKGETLFDKKEYSQVIKVVNMDTIRVPIMYPCEDINGDVFKWFAKNRKWKAESGISFYQKLPLLNSPDQTLSSHSDGSGFGNKQVNNYRKW